MNARQLTILVSFAVSCGVVRGSTLEEGFKDPPDSARPGVYWYFMDGSSLSVADLRSLFPDLPENIELPKLERREVR